MPQIQSLTQVWYRCQKVPVPRTESQEPVLRRYREVRGPRVHSLAMFRPKKHQVLEQHIRSLEQAMFYTGTTCRIAVSGAAWSVTSGVGPTYLIAGNSSSVWRWNQHSAGASVRPGGPFAQRASRMKALRSNVAPHRAELPLYLAARAAQTAGPPCSELRRSGGPQRGVPRPPSRG